MVRPSQTPMAIVLGFQILAWFSSLRRMIESVALMSKTALYTLSPKPARKSRPALRGASDFKPGTGEKGPGQPPKS